MPPNTGIAKKQVEVKIQFAALIKLEGGCKYKMQPPPNKAVAFLREYCINSRKEDVLNITPSF